MKKIKRNLLFNPGPATTTDSVKKALVVPDICPREKEFTRVISEIRKDLVGIVKGAHKDYTCVLFAGSGTAAMDACINSVIPASKRIAIINNGAYGQRMVNIAKTYKIKYVEMAFDPTEPVDIKKIASTLQKDKSISTLAFVHHETTTGRLNPLKEIIAVAKKYRKEVIVDAMSSYAGIPINIQKGQIDYLISSSNKCIQGMAGVAFVICKKKTLIKTQKYPKRSFYLNLFDHYQSLEKTGQTLFTAPVQILYALKQAIKEYKKEGGLKRYKRYTENWKALRKGLSELGFQFLLKEKEESHILTTVLIPSNSRFNFEKVHDDLYRKGFTLYPGKLESLQCFRIANIGDLRKKDILQLLKELKNTLKKLKINL